MAFRQPTYHAPQRIYAVPNEAPLRPPSPQESQPLQESQEWILFSPVEESVTDHTYTTSTQRTRTAGRSRISDFGSLDTAARSYSYDEEGSLHTEAVPEDEDDGELDSLDSHLHEFRTAPSVYRQSSREDAGEVSGTVLPTHDGLGSFRIDQTAMGADVQEHLYAFEQYNPRRVKRRRPSVELGTLELESERFAEHERTRRIEAWRSEQSRVLVDEIQRETRRRRQSLSSDRRSKFEDREQEEMATLSTVASSIGYQAADQDEVPSEEDETFWNRITRRVIRDLIGIDDDLLSIIFGEALPEDDLSAIPPASLPFDAAQSLISAGHKPDESSWEYRILARIARELGILVNQLSDHPGAFSTYLRIQQIPLPYAGLPVIPEGARDVLQPIDPQASTLTSISAPQFQPTIQANIATKPIPMPATNTSLSPRDLEDDDATPRANFLAPQPLSSEEWERDLDIKMVFRYIRSRFSSKFRNASASSTPTTAFHTHGTSHLATASTADTAARAARVRQNHPLITREKQRPRSYRASVPATSNPVVIHIRRASSSCASERRVLSSRRNSGSSRHYWDFGAASVGSGSLITSTGAMGSWGEV